MPKEKKTYKALSGETETAGILYLYGYIGEDYSWSSNEDRRKETITDKEILKQFKAFEKAGKSEIHIRINSPGGYTSHSDAIINIMQSSPMKVFTFNDGTAASAAADIFLAAKKENRRMAKNAKLMIHSTIIRLSGNATQLREAADMLEKFDNAAIRQMASDTGMTEPDIKEKYYENGADHWFTADEAVKIGFINEVADYEVENVLDAPEKMTYPELLKQFQQQDDKRIEGWLSKMFQRFQKTAIEEEQPIIQQKKSTQDMTIEELNKSIADGTLKIDDVVETVKANNYEVKKVTPPAPAGALTLEAVTKAMADAVKPIQEELVTMKAENAALKATITKLEDAPGADGPSGVASTGDSAPQVNKALADFNVKMAAAAKADSSVDFK